MKKYYIRKRAVINKGLNGKERLNVYYLIYYYEKVMGFIDIKEYITDFDIKLGHTFKSFNTKKEAEEYIKLLEKRDKINEVNK